MLEQLAEPVAAKIQKGALEVAGFVVVADWFADEVERRIVPSPSTPTTDSPTRPARSERPVQVEHRYQRCGALNLFAAFDTRSGKVIGKCYARKRQAEFIDFLAHIDAVTPAAVTTIHIVCDNLSTHHGKQVRAWLATRPRFVFQFTPVGCSWMNQVEQWFSILQRMRLRLPDCPDKAEL
ncbi:MAG: IS630 family transposase, partial [Planctomycetota bacterium]